MNPAAAAAIAAPTATRDSTADATNTESRQVTRRGRAARDKMKELVADKVSSMNEAAAKDIEDHCMK